MKKGVIGSGHCAAKAGLFGLFAFARNQILSLFEQVVVERQGRLLGRNLDVRPAAAFTADDRAHFFRNALQVRDLVLRGLQIIPREQYDPYGRRPVESSPKRNSTRDTPLGNRT